MSEAKQGAPRKKCIKCGETKGADSYTYYKGPGGRLNHQTTCKKCRASQEAKRRANGEDWISKHPEYRRVHPPEYLERLKRQTRERLTAQQRDSIPNASNHYKEWTGPELEMLLRKDLTAANLATILGRTLHSVTKMRRKVLRDPRKLSLAGLANSATVDEETEES